MWGLKRNGWTALGQGGEYLTIGSSKLTFAQSIQKWNDGTPLPRSIRKSSSSSYSFREDG